MFFFRACPKCHGDMYVERDNYGAYVQCLQCGLLRDVWSGAVSGAISNACQVNQLPSNRLEAVQLTA
jgi:hypothetical protein